jgi:hypothetical protein
MTQYYQCEMKELNGTRQTVGWIEERGAVKGRHVELKEFDTFFEIVTVHRAPCLSGEEIAEKQRLDRGSLPSIL